MIGLQEHMCPDQKERSSLYIPSHGVEALVSSFPASLEGVVDTVVFCQALGSHFARQLLSGYQKSRSRSLQ
jgi:hypothetical protein